MNAATTTPGELPAEGPDGAADRRVERATARRARFRDAVAGLSSRAERADLVQWVLFPGALAVVIGFLFMFLAWYGASRTHREIEQIPYLISGGLIGLGLVVLGGLLLVCTFWIAIMRKSQQEAEERFLRHSRELEERMTSLVATLGATSNGSARKRPVRSGER